MNACLNLCRSRKRSSNFLTAMLTEDDGGYEYLVDNEELFSHLVSIEGDAGDSADGENGNFLEVWTMWSN